MSQDFEKEYLQDSEEFDEAELLAELAREEAEEEARRLAAAAATVHEAGPQGAALTAYQEEIITTGSGVAIVILWILGFCFVVRGIQLLMEAISKMSALGEVKSVLSEAKTIAAHKVSGLYSHIKKDEHPDENYITTYCAPFEFKEEYERILFTEPHNKKRLKQLLVLRAKELLKRKRVLDRDEGGIINSFQKDMVPMEVWNDFRSARQQISVEGNLVNYESSKHQFTFGKSGTIFQYANEELQYEIERQEKYQKVRSSGRASVGMRNSRTSKAALAAKANQPGGPRRRRPKKTFRKGK